MQQLKPLKVPWQVSPSTPFLRLLAGEHSVEQPTEVVFVAHFGLRGEPTAQSGVGFPVAPQAVSPYGLPAAQDNESKTHGLVRMVFQEGLWARISPAFSDGEVVNPREFDSSLIPYAQIPDDIGAWLRDFQSLWLKSGCCPDPGAYTVEPSHWLTEVKGPAAQHFLIRGHDAYVEVLARDWKWEEVKKLPEWW